MTLKRLALIVLILVSLSCSLVTGIPATPSR
jgi:hypothetical protein